MKLTIDSYEVTISAKHRGGKADPKTTEALLNEIASAFYRQADHSDTLGCFYSAKRERKMADDIYYFLEARGCYDGIGENE